MFNTTLTNTLHSNKHLMVIADLILLLLRLTNSTQYLHLTLLLHKVVLFQLLVRLVVAVQMLLLLVRILGMVPQHLQMLLAELLYAAVNNYIKVSFNNSNYLLLLPHNQSLLIILVFRMIIPLLRHYLLNSNTELTAPKCLICL